jgi:hypothetical protein
MIVARHFSAWSACENGNRPVGHGMIGSDQRATIGCESTRGKDHTVPYRTDLFSNAFQALKCLATIIQSLRDTCHLLILLAVGAPSINSSALPGFRLI